MTKNKIFKKLDKRNTGFGHWAYYINRPKKYYNSPFTIHQSQQVFFGWREWCWSTWGPSKELVDWLEDCRQSTELMSHNEHWCFQNEKYATRIYLRTDKELSMFLLRWSQ